MAISGTGLRIVTALIALPFVLALIWYGGWPFGALVIGAIAVCLWEFGSMSLPGDRSAHVAITMIGVGMGILALTGVFASKAGLIAVVFLPIAVVCFFLFHVGEITTVASRAGM